MILGFTGARRGMTAAQEATVHELVRVGNWTLTRHGDCVGADVQFHDICRAHGVPVELHPATGTRWRAFCRGATMCHPALPPLKRNVVIVSNSDAMIATPEQPQEIRRSGTWSTIRRARERRVPLTIVLPDGSTEVFA